MQQDHPRMNITSRGDITVVELTDRKILDEVNISHIGERLQGLIARQAEPSSCWTFPASAHVQQRAGMLITLHKRIREKKGQLRCAASRRRSTRCS